MRSVFRLNATTLVSHRRHCFRYNSNAHRLQSTSSITLPLTMDRGHHGRHHHVAAHHVASHSSSSSSSPPSSASSRMIVNRRFQSAAAAPSPSSSSSSFPVYASTDAFVDDCFSALGIPLNKNQQASSSSSSTDTNNKKNQKNKPAASPSPEELAAELAQKKRKEYIYRFFVKKLAVACPCIPLDTWAFLLGIDSLHARLTEAVQSDIVDPTAAGEGFKVLSREARRDATEEACRLFREAISAAEMAGAAEESGDTEMIALAQEEIADLIKQLTGATVRRGSGASSSGGQDSGGTKSGLEGIAAVMATSPPNAHLVEGTPSEAVYTIMSRCIDEADELTQTSTVWTLRTVGRAGGAEAQLFARNLFDMYTKYANERRWLVDVVTGRDVDESGDEADSGHGGIDTKEAYLRIEGKDVFQSLRHEIGVHRVQRVPVTEKSGRMQTSTASVLLMPVPQAISDLFELKESDYTLDMCRGSGPGGQGVNKSNNCAVLFHKESGISLRCHQSRSGLENRAKVIEMLRQELWTRAYKQRGKSTDKAFSSQWGTGERNERIRSYNFEANRVTDHRIGWQTVDSQNFMHCKPHNDELERGSGRIEEGDSSGVDRGCSLNVLHTHLIHRQNLLAAPDVFRDKMRSIVNDCPSLRKLLSLKL